MKLLFCLGLIFSFLVAQAYDDCDNKRTEGDCNASPGVCYWNSSNVHKGHACVKFSGNCTVIKTNISTECTNAGGGLLCDWQILGADPGTGSCVDRCSRLNYISCNGHTYCWGWDSTSSKCLSCVEKGSTDCTLTGKCVLDTTCKVGCGGLYPGTQYAATTGGCSGNSSCYVSVTGNYGSYPGECKNFLGCAGIDDSTGFGEASCIFKGGNYNSECRWDTTTPSGNCEAVPPPCEKLTSSTCNTNPSCYWNSYRGNCTYLYNSCRNVQTHIETDCTNAKLSILGDYKNCVYKSGIGCVTSCTDYISTDTNPTDNQPDCNDRDDCWWDSSVTGTAHVAGCKNFTDCPTINNGIACSYTSKKSCYWNATNSNCVAFTHCSEIGTSEPCGTSSSRCKWNTTACVDNCTFIENQYDCQDRPDCGWNYNYERCEEYSSISISNCSSYTTYSSCPTERCYYQSAMGICLDRIFSPISDERGRGCSSYNNDNVACIADPKCVYNSGESLCLNYTSCDDITYSGFGGVFSRPQEDCNAKQGCIWEAGNDNYDCGMVIGKCVGVVGSPTDCSTIKDGVACYAASGQGCFWNSGSCVKGQCYLFNSLWCETNASCQWSSEFNRCLPKCSSFTTVTKCRENSDFSTFSAGCFWTGSSCSLFVGQENCSDITTYDDCNLKQCDWFSTNPLDITIGSCFSKYEKANLIVRGCDDIQNEKQCNEYGYAWYGYASCTYIWNADRGTGVCTYTNGLNCSWYKNQQQCTNTSSCYWNGNGYCQEYRECRDISARDCETAKECGLQAGYTSCSWYPCSSRLFGVCSGKCEWYKGSCYDVTDRRASLVSASRVSNSDLIVLGLGVSSDPCYGLYSDRLTCNANKTICNKGCIFNSQSFGGSFGCILFQNCSSIRYPLFQMPEIDCDARIPCYWNKGECGETAPPSRGKITKISCSGVASLLMVLLWLFNF